MVYRFLFSRRWLGWLAMVLAIAAGCAALGMWQMDRRDQAVAEVTRIQNNYEADPLSYEQALPYLDSFVTGVEWTPVTLHGTYDTRNQRVVRNRPLSGQPGYEVLVPLRLADGSAVIINRGWLPIGNEIAGHPDVVPQPQQGPVTVTARVKSGEPELDRGAPEGQLASIDLDAYANALDYPVHTGSYGLLASEDPAAATMPIATGKPAIDTGPHLSYSLQWFAFGVLACIGLGYAARQQARVDESEDYDAGIAAQYEGGSNAARIQRSERTDRNDSADGRGRQKTDRPTKPGRGRRQTAEEEEDALLDAQGYH